MQTETDSRAPVVLIVDDEVGILSAMRRTLRREGYEILTVEGPFEALAMIDEHKVDLVLSDQKMPGMSGVELLEEIGRRQPGIARLLITGWIGETGASELAELGIQGPIAKPWDDAELKEMLRKALAPVSRD
ncbi:MAG: response regulator [Deltaproteobacteria bacterium]|nr:response regulator [Deltaproteobacteria bacterium]MBW2389731.1 response regulator [Deltaproteobacteria bacterium]MBW2725353.1 response regulator [Deltaproteobacteria bacterium]